jgi:hypothetical protein
MAFQLKRKEAIGNGIKRTVRRQIEKALAHLRARGDPDETVLEVRKCFKRVRAALRLVRDDLVDTVYRRENFLFRDAARPLTEARDAVVLVDHDLAVLRQMLGADPLAYGGRGVLENLFSLIKRRRENLEQQAFVLGRSIYADTPTVFTNRMERSWKPSGSIKEKEPQEEARSTVTSARKER